MPLRLLTGALLAGTFLLPTTAEERAACELAAAELEVALEARERQALATMRTIGYAELTLPHEDPARQQARATAAEDVLRHIAATRHLCTQPPSLQRLFQIMLHILHIEASTDDAIIGQWARRKADHARKMARQHREQTPEYQQLRAKVLRTLAKHPDLTQRRLARLLDPWHVERMRKRLARLDFLAWLRRPKNKVGTP